MRDLMGIMKQAQAMQQKMQDIQGELEGVEVEGSAGGGAVRIVMTAKGLMKSVSIDPSILNPDEKEIVEDLVLAAANDARQKAERTAQDRMAELTKGLPLPPGLKLF
jgi:DNA-binding YbaB/EbfC family protein